jgi:hypothetical protein
MTRNNSLRKARSYHKSIAVYKHQIERQRHTVLRVRPARSSARAAEDVRHRQIPFVAGVLIEQLRVVFDTYFAFLDRSV